ncbi:MAG: hypothetical protein Q9196_002294 [Gyalolechia fulgens]
MFLDDVLSNADKYNNVRRADMVLCDRAVYVSTPSSLSRECLVFGNSYSSLSGPRQSWPPVNTMDVSSKLKLVYRPSSDGSHRAKRCVYQGDEACVSSFTVEASKYDRLLVVDCLNWISMGPTAMSQRPDIIAFTCKRRRADDMFGAVAPGFYMVPTDLSEPYAVDMQHSIESKGHGLNFSHQSLVGQAVSVASEMPRYSKERPPERRVCYASYGDCYQAKRAAILSTTTLHDKALPTNHYMLYVAAGILISLIGLAVTGHAIKRKLQYRATQPAPHPNKHNLAPGHVNNYVIIEEPENTLDPDSYPHPWYQRLWHRRQAVFSVSKWKKRFSRPRPGNERMVPNVNEAEKGNSLRKLHKKRGTKPEDRTDLPVRIMPPASAVPSRMPDGGLSVSAVLDNPTTNRNALNPRGGTVEGSSPAQQILSPKTVATRRSSRSSSA